MNPIATQLVVRETLRERIALAEQRRATATVQPTTPLRQQLGRIALSIRPRRMAAPHQPSTAARGA